MKRFSRVQQLSFGIFIVAFAGLGAILIFSLRAATPTSSAQPENGTVQSPATVLSDTSASGGKAVKFGNGSTTGGTLIFSDEFNGAAGTMPNSTV